MKLLHGRTVVITGGAGGIGQGLASAFGRAGANIVLADRDLDSLKRARAGLRGAGVAVEAVQLDVSDFEDWRRAVRLIEGNYGAIDILCNGAGTNLSDPVRAADPAHWRRVIDVNLLGCFHGCRAVLPDMLERGEEAHIVNIASLSGLCANPRTSAYAASKFGVVGLSDSLREELRGTSVGISLVCPGAVRTGFLINAGRMAGRDPDPTMSALLAAGMDPAMVGEQVVDAVLRNSYLVFTHGAVLRPEIEAVFAERLDAMEDRPGTRGG